MLTLDEAMKETGYADCSRQLESKCPICGRYLTLEIRASDMMGYPQVCFRAFCDVSKKHYDKGTAAMFDGATPFDTVIESAVIMVDIDLKERKERE